jgi:ribosomal protein S18 acetylase RimI-like enzyme
MSAVNVREARAEDARPMARVHVESWRETYRDHMADAVLDDPDSVARRERFWDAALTDERYAQNRAAVAEHEGEVIGIAMAGPQQQPDNDCDAHLYLIYVLAAYHGSGAGSALLKAVLDPGASASLWVVDPNPRAQNFYRKHGFRPDGDRRLEGDVSEIRMAAENEPDARSRGSTTGSDLASGCDRSGDTGGRDGCV